MRDQAATLRAVPPWDSVPCITPRKRVIAISGGKGGVGKSTIAVNLALAYASRESEHLRTLLIDGDLGMADLNLLLGKAPERTLSDLLRGTPADQVLIEADGLHFLPAQNGSFSLANLDPPRQQHLMALLAQLGIDFDTTIIDTAAGIQQSTIALTSIASEILVVATPEPLSLADAYSCLKVLATRERRTRVYLVPNAVRTADDALQMHAQLSRLSDRFLGIEIVLLPSIPHDPAVQIAAAEGRPLVLCRPDAPAARAIRSLARVLDDRAGDEQKSTGPTARLEAIVAQCSALPKEVSDESV